MSDGGRAMSGKTDRANWPMVLLVWIAGLGGAAQYGKISVIFDRLGTLYPDAGVALGFSVSMAGVMGILLGVVSGLFVAAYGYRRALVVALWLGALMSALQVLHLPFWLFLLTRVAEGMSHLGIVVAGPTLMAMLAPGAGRGLALTIWSTFFGVAFALLNWLGLPLVDRFGVLALFGAHAVIMAVLAVVLGRALRDLRVSARAPYPRLGDIGALHLSIYRSPRKVAPAAGWIFYTCCFVAILTVLPPFIPEAQRAAVMGAMPLVSIATSMTLGVALLRYVPGVRLAQAEFLGCAASMLWLWSMPGDWLACFALAAAFGLVQGASFAAVPQLNDSPADQAEANGVMSQAGNLGNVIGTPLMLAVIAMAGYGGLMVLLLGLFLSGAAVHQLLAGLRRRMG